MSSKVPARIKPTPKCNVCPAWVPHDSNYLNRNSIVIYSVFYVIYGIG